MLNQKSRCAGVGGGVVGSAKETGEADADGHLAAFAWILAHSSVSSKDQGYSFFFFQCKEQRT